MEISATVKERAFFSGLRSLGVDREAPLGIGSGSVESGLVSKLAISFLSPSGPRSRPTVTINHLK